MSKSRFLVLLRNGWIFVGNLGGDETWNDLENASQVVEYEGTFAELTHSAGKTHAVLMQCQESIGFPECSIVCQARLPKDWEK